DGQGFIPTDDHGLVHGLDGVFAAGDITTFPVKQGGLAAQQADAAAEAIAELAGTEVDPEPFRPVLRGMILTGGRPVYARAEPEPDRQSPHEDDEVYVVLEGRGTLEVEGEQVELREGHAVFVPAGAEHRFIGYEQLSVLVLFEKWKP